MPLVPSLSSLQTEPVHRPHRSVEGAVVADGPAPLHRHAVAVGEQHAAAHSADGEIEPVEACLRGADQGLDALAGELQLALRQPSRRLALGRVETVQRGRAAP